MVIPRQAVTRMFTSISPINRVSQLDPSILFDQTDSGAEILSSCASCN